MGIVHVVKKCTSFPWLASGARHAGTFSTFHSPAPIFPPLTRAQFACSSDVGFVAQLVFFVCEHVICILGSSFYFYLLRVSNAALLIFLLVHPGKCFRSSSKPSLIWARRFCSD